MLEPYKDVDNLIENINALKTVGTHVSLVLYATNVATMPVTAGITHETRT